MNYVVQSGLCAASGSAVISFAGEELNRYLSEMFPPNILQEKTFTFQLLGDGLRFDGYQIREEKNCITIEACQERGLLHGAYALLRHLGCSFLFPGEKRQRVPKLETWPLKDGFSVKAEPWLEYRGICFYHTTKETVEKTRDAIDWMAKNGFNFLMTSIHRKDDTGCGDHAVLWDEIGDQLLPEVQKRGIVLDMSEHSTDYYFPKEKVFAEHPEWFAQVDGKRSPGQLCYSNADAVEAYGDALAAFAKDKPWFQFMGIWPLDGGGYCECEHCRDPETIFRANRRIAQKLRKVRPDLAVEHLAYTPQSFARPTDAMPDNMSVLVCHVRDRVAYEWALRAKPAQGAFYFDYMTGDHYRYRSDVILNPDYCRDTVKTLISYGYRGVVSLYLPLDCWFVPSLNYWYLSHLYYEPTAMLGTMHRQLAEELFGTAGAEKGAKVLETIAEELLEPSLWSGDAHHPDWFCEHITNRCTALDRENAQRVDAACASLRNQLQQLQSQVEAQYRENTERMLDFVELQQLYYHGVDQYDADRDTAERAEPYFQKLRELEQKPDSPFISERYARWRVTGRDNIFDPEKTNLFQANP